MTEYKSEMKISDVLVKLKNLQIIHGDLPVFVTHEWTEGLDSIEYHAEYNGKFDHFPERVEIA